MPKKLLIIEDDLDIQQILCFIFMAEGYEVMLSQDGAIAGDLQVPFPDLILMDVNLKGAAKNGDVICQMLKTEPATHYLPVVLLSAEADLDLISQACGADAFVCKPFDLMELTAIVGVMIRPDED